MAATVYLIAALTTILPFIFVTLRFVSRRFQKHHFHGTTISYSRQLFVLCLNSKEKLIQKQVFTLATGICMFVGKATKVVSEVWYGS